MTNTQQQLQNQFPKFDFRFDFPLREMTYFKVGGPAEVYLELANRDDLIEIVKYCFSNDIKLTMIGAASNVVISDHGIKGLVLHLLTDQLEIEDYNQGNKKIVRVDAGIRMSMLVRSTIDASLTGLEYFLGVPGTLGGAVYNNAHYLQNLISQYVYRVEVLDKNCQVKWVDQKDCGFDYDLSRFQKTAEIILRVELLLEQGNMEKSKQMVQKATIYRAKTQPLGNPNSGCIFQNIPNDDRLQQIFPEFKDKAYVPAGFIIDKAGLKGLQHGGIKVSEKHAAFMINTGTGTASEVKDLINIVKRKVRDKYDIELTEEVFWLE